MLLMFLLAVAILANVLQYLYKRFYTFSEEFLDLAHKIPGPTPIPILGSAHKYINATPNTILHTLDEACKEYQPVCGQWIGPYFFAIVSNPHDIDVVMSSKTKAGKGIYFKQLSKALGDGILISEGEKWKKHRKLLNPMFTTTSVQDNYDNIVATVDDLWAELEHIADNTDYDFLPISLKYAFRIMTGIAVNSYVQTELRKAETELIDILCRSEDEILMKVYNPWLNNDFIYNTFSTGIKFNKDMRFVENVIRKLMSMTREYKEMQSSKNSDESTLIKETSFLDFIMDIQEMHNVTDDQVVDEARSIAIAGFTTSAVAVAFSLMQLSRHPEIQEKVYQEIIQVLGPGTDPVAWEDIPKLTYLNQVMKECLRHYPPVPYVTREMQEDTKLPCGLTLPRGTQVIVAFYLMHKDPNNFPNPEVFDPDNFLPHKVALQSPGALAAFGLGPRTCIGKKFGIVGVKLQLVQIIRRFVLTPVDYKPDIKATGTLGSSNGVRLGIKRRVNIQK